MKVSYLSKSTGFYLNVDAEVNAEDGSFGRMDVWIETEGGPAVIHHSAISDDAEERIMEDCPSIAEIIAEDEIDRTERKLDEMREGL